MFLWATRMQVRKTFPARRILVQANKIPMPSMQASGMTHEASGIPVQASWIPVHNSLQPVPVQATGHMVRPCN